MCAIDVVVVGVALHWRSILCAVGVVLLGGGGVALHLRCDVL